MQRLSPLTLALVAFLVCAPALVAQGPGLYELSMESKGHGSLGVASVWNSPRKLHLKFTPNAGLGIAEIQVFVGDDIAEMPTNKNGHPRVGQFPWKEEFRGDPRPMWDLVIDLQDELGFGWGSGERVKALAVHAELVELEPEGRGDGASGVWVEGPYTITWGRGKGDDKEKAWWFTYELAHPMRGQFIDSPVQGLTYSGPTQQGVTGLDDDGDGDPEGGFLFFADERVTFSIDRVDLGTATAAKAVSPLDLFGADLDDSRVIGVARALQSLDSDGENGRIFLPPEVAECFADVAASVLVEEPAVVDWGDGLLVQTLLDQAVGTADFDGACDGLYTGEDGPVDLVQVSEAEAIANLEDGLNASGIFRKNVSKTEEYGESNQKLEVMPVYFPGVRSDGEPSYCDLNANGVFDDGIDLLGVPYEEWRLGGDPSAEECDPRDFEDPEACKVTLIECRELAKPLIVAYMERVDLSEAKTDFNTCHEDLPEGVPCRESYDIYAAVSRDDGTTWKRMNVSRMADLTSFELESTGEPFPGTCNKPMLKVNDNQILLVWESKFCKSGTPRYAIDDCERYPDDCVDLDGDGINESVCRGNPEQGTYVCEADYPYDDEYYVTDIWGVRGQQRSVDYDEVDDVADLGIGEIPYSCLWAARGAIATRKDLDDGVYASMTIVDDNGTPDDPSDDFTRAVELGDVVWYKPERLTSGRRDAYIPVIGAARGSGFALAWQEDPEGLRPGKGKGPGMGWSGAISNHKTDIWYSWISYEEFPRVDANFVPGGPPESEGPDEKPGLGRPKALVPFALPVRISDNDMVNTDTLKVQLSSRCVTPPDGVEPVCFPEVVDGTFLPLDPDDVASQFCDHPDADPATCCDPENHDDPNCEGLEGLYGNMTGTKRFAYLARTIDNDQDGVPDYQYYVDRGGVLDLCDTSGANAYVDQLPGTTAHERWFGFANAAESSKLVCVTADGRLLDGDVSASRPNIMLQPYTRGDGTKSAWVLLAYEESKGMGHSLDASDHDDELVTDDSGQDKPTKQDLGKNVIYHTFDYMEPDLVSPGHIVNLPALCGGLYPSYCDDPDNPTCTCEPGQPVPLYFEYQDADGEWLPDPTKLLQYRTEIARRARFIAQSPGKMGPAKTLGAIIFKQGQEGQGRPADVFIRRLVKSGTSNPYDFSNFECRAYLDETFALPGCPTDGVSGYSCNVWGEAYGDRLCGGIFADPYPRRDHVNLTSADIDLSVDAGPEDDTPDDPTDDIYGTDKVLLWSQHDYNLGDESYGEQSGTGGLSGMFSNARSHRGFIRGDFLVAAYAWSPNWAAGRNGNDRYNFYIRKSFDGGQTWTTTPGFLGGEGIVYCSEWRTDPNSEDPDGTGGLPPEFPGFDAACDPCAEVDELGQCVPTDTGTEQFLGAGTFEPARNVSEIPNNKETSSDPRVGATPPTYPLDGTDPTLPVLRFVEDEYVDNVFFVAWGTGDNTKSTGGQTVTPEAPPLDVYYTRSQDYGDTFLKVPWDVNGEDSNYYGETVWRYERLAWGEEEQGECQLRATSDGSKMYGIYHQLTPPEEDPDAVVTRWYPWEPEVSFENDVWFRRVIFWDETLMP